MNLLCLILVTSPDAERKRSVVGGVVGRRVVCHEELLRQEKGEERRGEKRKTGEEERSGEERKRGEEERSGEE